MRGLRTPVLYALVSAQVDAGRPLGERVDMSFYHRSLTKLGQARKMP
jgi:hypothetical protein